MKTTVLIRKRRMHYFLAALFSAALLLAAGTLPAQSVDPAVEKNIREQLSVLLPGVSPNSVTATPAAGIYEVMFGPRIVYVTEDARFLVQGNIIDMQTRENITEPRLKQAKIDAIENVGNDNMLVFSPGQGTPVKHTVNVFTDIDCGFCRKLHGEMDAYNKAGIEIRYLFFPRAGKGTASYKKALQVWCADDRHKAMTTAKAGESLDSATDCNNPVDDHMVLGALLGVTGTPALIFEDGSLLPGYVPADRLSKMLEAQTPKN